MAKIFIGVPVFNLQSPLVAENHQKIIRESSHEIVYSSVTGHSVEHARQILIDAFLKTNCDVYLTMDADIIFQTDNPIDKLYFSLGQEGLDIVGGLYFYKRSPCLPVYRPLDLQEMYEKDGKFPDDYKFEIPDKLFEVAWLGNGFKMVKREVIQKLKDSISVPNLPMIHKGEYVSEDWAFDLRAREMGFKVWVIPTIKLGHLGQHIYTQEDFNKYNGKSRQSGMDQ